MGQKCWELGRIQVACAESAARSGRVVESIRWHAAARKSERLIVVMKLVKAGGAKGP